MIGTKTSRTVCYVINRRLPRCPQAPGFSAANDMTKHEKYYIIDKHLPRCPQAPGFSAANDRDKDIKDSTVCHQQAPAQTCFSGNKTAHHINKAPDFRGSGW